MPVDSPERAALVDWLIERSGGSDAKDGRGAAAAHWAAKWGMPLCLGSLSRSGADLNAKDNAGLVPLMWAAMRIDAYQEGGAIDVLVDSGAGVCEVDKAGSTALHHACRNPGALAALCKAGAPLEAKNRLGRTALHEACLANRAASVGALLAAGADPRACDAKGRFPHEFGGGKAARIAFAAYEAAEVSLSANVLASERRPAPRV
jgi:ankyrin repeat protein